MDQTLFPVDQASSSCQIPCSPTVNSFCLGCMFQLFLHVSNRSAGLSDFKCNLWDGRFLALGQDKAAGHSVLGSSPSTGYTVLPGVDMPSSYNLAPVNSTCSSNRTAPNVTDVNSCSNYNSGLGICCLDAGPYTVSELGLGRPVGKAVTIPCGMYSKCKGHQ